MFMKPSSFTASDRSGIQKFSFVHLLIDDVLIKKMVPDEPATSECLPDENLLLHSRFILNSIHLETVTFPSLIPLFSSTDSVMV